MRDFTLTVPADEAKSPLEPVVFDPPVTVRAGEPGVLEGTRIIKRTFLPARRVVDENGTRTTMVVPLHGLPEAPELFRPVDRPLGMCPLQLTQPALAAVGGFALPSGWVFG